MTNHKETMTFLAQKLPERYEIVIDGRLTNQGGSQSADQPEERGGGT